MSHKQIRTNQLIAPFGPGSIYTDRRGIPHVIAGLDHWYMRWDQNAGVMTRCEDRTEFMRFDKRLSELLRINCFCLPPDYRHVSRDHTAPPNASLHIPALRFPRWYRNTKSGVLRKFNLDSERIDRPADGSRWQPVRFIAVCPAGHLCEFPWQEWIGCSCEDPSGLVLSDRGGSDLTSVSVRCDSCPDGSPGKKGRSLSGTTTPPDVAAGEMSAFQMRGINCPGGRPWLGSGAEELGCNEPLIGALINQTNIYFARNVSAIALPDLQTLDEPIAKLKSEIEKEQGILAIAKSIWEMGQESHAMAAVMVQNKLQGRAVFCDTDNVKKALDSLFSPGIAELPAGSALPTFPESDLLSFRRAEFNILRNKIDDREHTPDLRVIPTKVPSGFDAWLSRVNLVERLRETRVFYGFDRLKEASSPLSGMPATAMTQLFRNPPAATHDRWLPASEVFGEGIYIELNEERIEKWQKTNAKWLETRVNDAFVLRLTDIHKALPPLAQANRDWATRYLLVHTFAHILINQLVFECGYSTASLRERLFVSSDPSAPMAGIMIYTAAGDSEGTLGGLVRLGRPELLGNVIRRAVGRASWCSADPVCSENFGGTGSQRANLAACHACVLLPETSCETINHGLDRAMVVGTPEHGEAGYLYDFVHETYSVT